MSRRLGLKGAACIAKAIDWKLSHFQDLLVFCVQENDAEMANIALSLGAVATPELLNIAYQRYPKNDFSLLRLLILSGAQIEDLLFKAIENNQVELIEFLLTDAKAKQLVNPNISDSKGQTALMLAIQKNQLKTVSLLLGQLSMNMNQVDAHGNTALHHAAMLGKNDIIKLLMKQHASIKDKNKENKTPVQLARENGHKDLANWMEEKHQYKKIKPFLKPLQAKLEEQKTEIAQYEKSAQQKITSLAEENHQLREELKTLSERYHTKIELRKAFNI